MASVRQIRRRIKSVKSTKQITRAMQMVAAAKLKKSQSRLLAARPYARKMDELLSHLAAATGQIRNPLFEKRELKKAALVVISGDKGLCGSYNINIMRKAEIYLSQMPKGKMELILIGKKGYEYFRRRGYPIYSTVIDLGGNLHLGRIQDITRQITTDFLNGTFDEIQLLFTNYLSAVRYQPVIVRFLPIEQKDPSPGKSQVSDIGDSRKLKTASSSVQYIFEPDAKSIFDLLLPRYLNTKIHISLAESFTSEHSARMVAMQNATDAALEMIDSLTLIGNKLRQAQITKEIAEIVGGAEALVK